MNALSTVNSGTGATSKADCGNKQFIELCGSLDFLKSYGLEAIDLAEVAEFESCTTLIGLDGYEWQVKNAGHLFTAKRRRTSDEQVAWIDRMNARTHSGDFSRDRQEMCRLIALELDATAGSLNPEKPLPREARRALKTKLAVLANVQEALVNRGDMQHLRTRLSEVGLIVPQVPYYL